MPVTCAIIALLRWLAPPRAPQSPRHRLGVVCYRTADETHNADGKHVAYLDRQDPVGRREPRPVRKKGWRSRRAG